MTMQFIDTHCHIHFPDYELDPLEVMEAAQAAGVTKLLCVGCTLKDSKLAVSYAKKYPNVWATVGLHPHEAVHYVRNNVKLSEFHELSAKAKVVAIGEIGLDYHYNHSDAEDQKKLLHFQLDIAYERKLPAAFHVREAFEDFWKIYDSYPKIPGVVHSFSAGSKELHEILKHDLFVGVNGIATFSKNPDQLAAYKAIPLEKLVLETDAPFLTPTPYRGKINEPKMVVEVAKFLSELKNESLEKIAEATTKNARQLFGI